MVGDSDWELKFCETLERMPEVLAYVKNHNMGFEVPYADKDGERRYRRTVGSPGRTCSGATRPSPRRARADSAA